MPECKALKTFNSAKYGFIRYGSRFSSEKGYANELRIRGLIEILPDPLEPARVQALEGAPARLGKEPSASPPPSAPETAAPPADGEAKRSLLSRVGRASRRAIATTSKGDAKP
jgi:hypothetical protein